MNSHNNSDSHRNTLFQEGGEKDPPGDGEGDNKPEEDNKSKEKSAEGEKGTDHFLGNS